DREQGIPGLRRVDQTAAILQPATERIHLRGDQPLARSEEGERAGERIPLDETGGAALHRYIQLLQQKIQSEDTAGSSPEGGRARIEPAAAALGGEEERDDGGGDDQPADDAPLSAVSHGARTAGPPPSTGRTRRHPQPARRRPPAQSGAGSHRAAGTSR